MSDARFDKFMKKLEETFSDKLESKEGYDCKVIYANTDAKINFFSSFCLFNNDGGIIWGRCIGGCDFENVNLNHSDIDFVQSIYNSNFVGTNLEGNEIDCRKTVISNCNFVGTGLNFRCDLTNSDHLFMLKESRIDGCFINGKPTTVERDDEKTEYIRQASNDLFDSYVQAIQNAELVSAEPTGRGRH